MSPKSFLSHPLHLLLLKLISRNTRLEGVSKASQNTILRASNNRFDRYQEISHLWEFQKKTCQTSLQVQLRKWKWFMGDSKSLCVTLQNTRRSLTRRCGILCVFRLGIAERYDVWASSPPPGHRDKKSRQKLNSPDLDLASNFIPSTLSHRAQL